MVGRANVRGLHVVNEAACPAIAQGAPVVVDLSGLAQNVVVDVGHILDITDLVSQELQVADEDVKAGVGEQVAKVGRVVGRDAADVDADRPGP